MLTLFKPIDLVAQYESLRSLLATVGPDSLQARRDRAIEAFAAAGLPTLKDEEFKYVSLKVLEEGGFKPAYGATVDREEIEATPVGKTDAITLAFVNGEYAPELSSVDILPEGVMVTSLRDALESHADRVLSYLGKAATLEGKLGSTNDERFVNLNTAFLSDGAFVYIPRGVVLERPVHLVFATKANHGPLVAHPRALIVLEEGAVAKVLESHLGLQGVAFVNAVTEVVLERDSNLEHTRFQNDVPDGVHIANVSAWQDGNSTYTNNNATFGAKIARNDVNVWIDGEHTETWLNGSYLGLKNQVVDNHTRIDHAKPNCHSFEVYKGILSDKATGIFNGKIFVYEDAQKTDAKQTNQALLLSPEATLNTKPQLEIFADDVKCTHGATVGQLREDALFYLRARGVPLKQAQALLVYAFVAEVLDKITLDDVRESLEALLYERLGNQ